MMNGHAGHKLRAKHPSGSFSLRTTYEKGRPYGRPFQNGYQNRVSKSNYCQREGGFVALSIVSSITSSSTGIAGAPAADAGGWLAVGQLGAA